MTITVSSCLGVGWSGFTDSHACRKPLPPRSKARARSNGVHTRCIAFIVMLAIALPIVAGCLLPLLNGPAMNGCLPNGDYATIDSSANFNLWANSEYLTITIAFGTLSFSTVKLIDLIWDVVVGRCGQTLLAFVTFQFSLNQSFIQWRREQSLIKHSPSCLSKIRHLKPC